MIDEPKKSARRYDIDWIRVIAVCILVMIHTAAMFDPAVPITSIKGQPSLTLGVFSTFMHEWRLALLFIVSGAGSYFALGFLSGKRFVRFRFKRILIPLVMGTLLLVPIHHYFGQLFENPAYPKNYLQFNAKILGDFFRFGSFGQGRESLHWAHLWFLAYLFVSSLVALPLFLYLRREAGRQLIARVAGFVSRRWVIFLFALPLVVIEATLRAKFYWTRLIIVDDWAGFLFYLTLFIYGFVIVSDERITAAIERHRKSALLLGLLTSAFYLYMAYRGRIPPRGYNMRWTIYMALRGFNAWFWCVAILGFGSKHLRFNHRILPYANAAVYPVYILHLPIATVIAYWVVGWNIGVPAQFILITLVTLIISVSLYEFIIRRTKVTRFLFGLKTEKPKRSDDSAASTPERARPAEASHDPQIPEEVASSSL